MKIIIIIIIFIKLLLKLSDFINSDDCFGKITYKSIRQQPVFMKKKKLKFIKKQIFLLKKWEIQVVLRKGYLTQAAILV